MRFIRHIGWIALCLAFPFALQAKVIQYTVKKGDTLISIAKTYHVRVADIRKRNRLSSDTIRVGQTLRIATSRKSKRKRKTVKTHRQTRRLASVLKHKGSKPVTIGDIIIKQPQRKKSLSDIVFGDILRYDTASLSPKSQRIIELAKQNLGKRYVWGAAGKNAFDCSGLTSYVCKMNGIKLPRRAIEQSKVGLFVPRDQLQPGDLVFFDTSKQRRGYVNHVGIYIGDGKFIHASSAKKKVIITSLDKPFYKSRYKGARRVVASL